MANEDRMKLITALIAKLPTLELGWPDAAKDRWFAAYERLRATALAEDPEVLALRQQKDGAYAERNKLVAALSKFLPSHLARHPESDTSWEDDWRWIVVVNAPAGQMTWHIHDTEREMFNHLDVRADYTWDGHDTDEKYRRLAALGAL